MVADIGDSGSTHELNAGRFTMLSTDRMMAVSRISIHTIRSCIRAVISTRPGRIAADGHSMSAANAQAPEAEPVDPANASNPGQLHLMTIHALNSTAC